MILSLPIIVNSILHIPMTLDFNTETQTSCPTISNMDLVRARFSCCGYGCLLATQLRSSASTHMNSHSCPQGNSKAQFYGSLAWARLPEKRVKMMKNSSGWRVLSRSETYQASLLVQVSFYGYMRHSGGLRCSADHAPVVACMSNLSCISQNVLVAHEDPELEQFNHRHSIPNAFYRNAIATLRTLRFLDEIVKSRLGNVFIRETPSISFLINRLRTQVYRALSV
ncbi:hypothetical protein B0H34DRAFT_498063 [Crassisporium funariophilum]|nr:hypothetical protein B0H34DRAFT_498063 [Crassisporium funariophilum]